MKTANFVGYTLIELLVVISIITIVFTLGIAGFRSFSRRQELTGIVKQVIADLRSAQQSALVGQKPVGDCASLQGYTFTIVSPTAYQIVANCLPDITVKNIDLSATNIRISGNYASVQFKVLGQGTSLSANLILTLANQLANISNQITVGTGGHVE